MVAKRGVGVGEGWIGSLGLAEQTIIYRMDKQQGPTVHSTGAYIQHPVINHNGKEKGRVDILSLNDGRSLTVPADWAE